MGGKNKRIFEDLPKNLNECAHCHWALPKSEFHINPEMLSGLGSWCKQCDKNRKIEDRKINPEKQRTREKIWRKNNHKKVAAMSRKKHLKTEYGISEEKYDDMYIEQGGRCGICGIHQSSLKIRFAVDHCHKMNVNRGLLCRKCNLLLGNANDNPKILMNAIKYLGDNNGG